MSTLHDDTSQDVATDGDIATLKHVNFACLRGDFDVTISTAFISLQACKDGAIVKVPSSDATDILVCKTRKSAFVVVPLWETVKHKGLMEGAFVMKFFLNYRDSAHITVPLKHLEKYFPSLVGKLEDRFVHDIIADMISAVAKQEPKTGLDGFSRVHPDGDECVKPVECHINETGTKPSTLIIGNRGSSVSAPSTAMVFPRRDEIVILNDYTAAIVICYENIRKILVVNGTQQAGIVVSNGDVVALNFKETHYNTYQIFIQFMFERVSLGQQRQVIMPVNSIETFKALPEHLLSDLPLPPNPNPIDVMSAEDSTTDTTVSTADETAQSALTGDNTASTGGIDADISADSSIVESETANSVNNSNEVADTDTGGNATETDATEGNMTDTETMKGKIANPDELIPEDQGGEVTNAGETDIPTITVNRTPSETLEIAQADGTRDSSMRSSESSMSAQQPVEGEDTIVVVDDKQDGETGTTPSEIPTINTTDSSADPVPAHRKKELSEEESSDEKDEEPVDVDSDSSLLRRTASPTRGISRQAVVDASLIVDDSASVGVIDDEQRDGALYKGADFHEIRVNSEIYAEAVGVDGCNLQQYLVRHKVGIDLSRDGDDYVILVFGGEDHARELCVEQVKNNLDIRINLKRAAKKSSKATQARKAPPVIRELSQVIEDSVQIPIEYFNFIPEDIKTQPVKVKGLRENVANCIDFLTSKVKLFHDGPQIEITLSYDVIHRIIGDTDTKRKNVMAKNKIKHLYVHEDGVTVTLIPTSTQKQAVKCMELFQRQEESLLKADKKRKEKRMRDEAKEEQARLKAAKTPPSSRTRRGRKKSLENTAYAVPPPVDNGEKDALNWDERDNQGDNMEEAAGETTAAEEKSSEDEENVGQKKKRVRKQKEKKPRTNYARRQAQREADNACFEGLPKEEDLRDLVSELPYDEFLAVCKRNQDFRNSVIRKQNMMLEKLEKADLPTVVADPPPVTPGVPPTLKEVAERNKEYSFDVVDGWRKGGWPMKTTFFSCTRSHERRVVRMFCEARAYPLDDSSSHQYATDIVNMRPSNEPRTLGQEDQHVVRDTPRSTQNSEGMNQQMYSTTRNTNAQQTVGEFVVRMIMMRALLVYLQQPSNTFTK